MEPINYFLANFTSGRESKRIKKIKTIFLILNLVLIAIAPSFSFAATKTFSNTINNNFSTAGNWTPMGVPAAGDDLVITNTCVFDNGANNLVYGNLTLGKLLTTGTLQWPAGGTNTLTVNNVSSDIVGSSLNMANGGTLKIKGTWNEALMSFTPGSGTIHFNNTTASATFPLTITTYNNVIIETGNQLITVGSATTIMNGVLSILSGTFRENSNVTVVGDVDVSGVLQTFGSLGTKAYSGNITINPGGSWDCTVAENFSIAGSITNNGTFTSGSATYTFTGTSKTFSGSSGLSISKATITGSYTNNITVAAGLSISTSLSGAGSLTQGTGSLLYIGGTSGITTLNATGVLNKVIYNGSSAQTIKSGTYYYLTTASSAKTLGGDITVYADFVISSGSLSVSATPYNITLAGNWTNSGTFSAQTGTVTLNGTGAQSITNSAGETFYNLVIGGIDTKSSGGNITVNNDLTITGTLDVTASNYAINLKRDWINNGIFNARQGTVTLNGTGAQTIGGTVATTFANLTLNNPAGASISNAENITGTLTLTSGTFTTTGQNFTLISDANGTARIAAIPTGADIIGDIIMERYLAPGPTSWRFLSSAVSGRTLNDWNDDFIMTGFSGSPYPTFSFTSVYSYNETVAGASSLGYIPPTGITDPINTGQGFWAYIGPVPLTIDVKGPAIKGDQSLPVTYTSSPGGSNNDGWCMVGNPYPSTIDWDAVSGWTKNNISNATYIWNNAAQQYAVYQGGVGTNGGSRYIGSSQAFWVQTTGNSPLLSLTENVKAATDIVFKTNNETPPDALKLFIAGNGYTDEAVLQFKQDATSSFDPDYDAYKLFSSNAQVPSLSTIVDSSSDLSINALPLLTSGISIPLRAKAGVTGNYTITADISQLGGSTLSCVLLEDLVTGTIKDLRVSPAYTFNISNTVNASPRFMLHFSNPLQRQISDINCNNADNGAVIISGESNSTWNFTWKDMQGNIIQTTGNASSDTLDNLTPGYYVLTVSGGGCSDLTDTISIEEPSQINALVNYTNESCNYSNDGAIDITVSGGNPPFTYQWSNGEVTEDLSDLNSGIYNVVITDANACPKWEEIVIATTTNLIAAFDINTDSVATGENVQFTNTSSGAQSYTWDFGDGSASNSSTNPTHAYSYAGIYNITLEANYGSCSETYSNTIVVSDLSTTGYAELQQGNNLQIIHSDNAINVSFNLDEQAEAIISVLNMIGQKVMEDIKIKALKNSVKIDVKDLAFGTYIIKVNIEDNQVTGKFLH